MKQFLSTLFLLLSVAALAPLCAQTDSARCQRLAMLADSVVAEVRTLYLYEYAAQQSAKLLADAGIDSAQIGASGITIENGILRHLTVNRQGRLIFEYMLEIKSLFALTSTKQRQLDADEMSAIMLRTHAIQAALKAYGDNLRPASEAEGSLHYDVLRLADGCVRVYTLQTTPPAEVMPVGNDACMEFDALLRPRGFVRQHAAYAELPIHAPLVHRHAANASPITATDVVAFMLYAHNRHGVPRMAVRLSGADAAYSVVFDAKTFAATICTASQQEALLAGPQP